MSIINILKVIDFCINNNINLYNHDTITKKKLKNIFDNNYTIYCQSMELTKENNNKKHFDNFIETFKFITFNNNL